MKQFAVLIISLGLVSVMGYLVFEQNQNQNFIYSNFGARVPDEGTVLGIDVSHHQGSIDWDMALSMNLGNDSIQFVYLKATEGSDFKDRHYEENRAVLDTKKVKVGAYHFYNPLGNVRSQVMFFKETVAKTSLKPVLDIELMGNLNAQQCVDSISKFLSIAAEELGTRPIIYTYESFYNDVFKNSSLKSELFWIANFKTLPQSFVYSNFVAWQFSEKGTINGIKEKVDLNKAKFNFFEKAKW